MRSFLALLSVCTLVLAQSSSSSSEGSSSESASKEMGGPGKKDGGLYFDEMEVTLACTAGTPVGAKLATAFDTCFGEEEPEMEAAGRRRKGAKKHKKNKKPKKKCLSAEALMKHFGDKMEGGFFLNTFNGGG